MYLNSIELVGFKSFPEKTVIEFHSGMTAVVGPNGSGKSNISDAIRWVLGEQSPRYLRGKKMEDLIFSGTEKRKPVGYCQVSLNIQNEDGKLPIDYSEVQVTRRLFRSGESEYLINQTPVRLKDIYSLFMDTGIGKDGYSIIGQGRVEELLSVRSEDRRKVFEEAAGIIKYKSKRDEAVKKLDKTTDHLQRVSDILDEIESKLDPLKKQANKAEKYIAYRTNLKTAEIDLSLLQVGQIEAQKITMLENLKTIQVSESDIEKKEADLKKDYDLHMQAILTEEESHKSLQESLSQLIDKKAQNEQDMALSKQKLDQFQASILELNQSCATDLKQKEDIQLELRRFDAQRDFLQKRLSSVEDQGKSLQTELLGIQSSLLKSEEENKGLKDEENTVQVSYFDVKSNLSQKQAQKKQLEEQSRLDIDVVDKLEDQMEGLKSEVAGFDRQLLDLNQQKEKITDEISTEEENLQTIKGYLDEENEKIQNLDIQKQSCEYKIKAHLEIQKNYEGYNQTVRELLGGSYLSDGLKRSVRGTVADLLDVPDDYVTAIEVALGPVVENIVVDNDKTAADLIGILRQERLGRATFLPISVIDGRTLDNRVIQELRYQSGVIGLASDLIGVSDDLIPILKHLLGRTVVVKSMQDASQLAKSYRYQFKIVTLEGDIINPGGAYTGGYRKTRKHGFINRSRVVDELKKEKDEILAKMEAIQVKIVEDQQVFFNKTQTYTQLKNEADILERTLVQVQSKRDLQVNVLEQRSLDLKQKEGEKVSIKDKIQTLGTEILDLEKTIEEQNTKMETVRESLREQVDQLQTIKLEEESVKNKLRDFELEVHKDSESLKYADEKIQWAQDEIVRLDTQLEQYTTKLDQTQQSIVDLGEKLDLGREQAQTIQDEQLVLEDQMHLIQAQKDAKKQEQEAFFEQMRELNEERSLILKETTRIESKIERFDFQMAELKNRLWEQYELTYLEVEDQYEVPKDKSVNQLNKQIQVLKNQMKDLGPVNLQALEDFEKENKRFTFLSKQKEDILKAKEDLSSIVYSITREMRKTFKDSIAGINKEFNTVFHNLFGGGHATIVMDPNEDVLETSIEIDACPPGKKLQNMLLLSGGERALTAIALLFSILKWKPTPFVVLDEIEAALDDVNVHRFTEYVKRYSSESQFILVTHRKGTMQACERIYGVTMEEKGVSRVISIQLED